MADFSFSDNLKLHELSALVVANPDNFDHWNNLIEAAEQQEDGINRNSSAAAISALRTTYDMFLTRFPLFYAFWKRYADLEYRLAGTEAAESIYERGVASTSFSLDLRDPRQSAVGFVWQRMKFDRPFGTFRSTRPILIDTSQIHSRIALNTELDIYNGGYLSAEQTFRLVQIPLYQYAKYYKRYQEEAYRRPIDELADGPTMAELQQIIQQEHGADAVKAPQVYTQALRSKLEKRNDKNYEHIQQEVTNRWQFEQNIKRPFYHVTELPIEERENWHQYLDFEEKGVDNYDRVKALYERCLVAAADYDEFWFRYARWMIGQDRSVEEVRNIYVRASCVFTKITQPGIRLAWAKYEEAHGRAEVAIEIHEAILMLLPDDFETYRSMVNLRRRISGIPEACRLLHGLVVSESLSMETRGALLVEWSRIEWQIRGDYSAAMSLFTQYRHMLAASHTFWSGWLQFGIDRPAKDGEEKEVHQLVKSVHHLIHTTKELSRDAMKALAVQYIGYLDVRGGSDAIEESVLLDAFVNSTDGVRGSKTFGTLFNDDSLRGTSYLKVDA
ncbi:hypothetical protein AMS68_005634 [Peltaster fructicola]|uniref:Suppressor of forked domain-containing protein n=1 Tax=Peltaster fructicola TaxID=286661 RepID=A0A6H0XZE0_9PEZI|nr:hypothetical protein AMS68_005634 [Peltaster fructicola]